MNKFCRLLIVSILFFMIFSLKAAEVTSKPAVKIQPITDLIVGRKYSDGAIQLNWQITKYNVKNAKTVKVYEQQKITLAPQQEGILHKISHDSGTNPLKINVSAEGKNETWQFNLYPYGAITMNRKMSEENCGGSTIELSKCREIAEKFLNENGLMENNAVFSNIVDNVKALNCISVTFKCTGIDGIPAEGAGARLCVEISPKTQTVVRLFKSWPNPGKVVGEFPLIPINEAIANFNSGNAWFDEMPIGKVVSMELIYLAPPLMECEHIIPIYKLKILRGKCDGTKADDFFHGYAYAFKADFKQDKYEESRLIFKKRLQEKKKRMKQ